MMNVSKRNNFGQNLSTLQKGKRHGLIYSDEGKCVGIEPNTYARHVLQNIKLRSNDEGVFYQYLNNKWHQVRDLELRRFMWKFFNEMAADSCTRTIENTYMHILPLVCENTEALVSPEKYINLKNGLLDLETFELVEHTDSIFSTVQLPVNYDPEAKCPQFKAFLKTLFEGDRERISLICEALGYALCSDNRHQRMIILWGSSGANGKSTLLTIFKELLGGDTTVSTVALSDFEDKFARCQIVDKQVNISSEHSMSRNVLETKTIKAITGGDSIQIERKFEHPFTYRPRIKLIVALNELQRTCDNKNPWFRRLLFIPFYCEFVDNPVAPHQVKIDRDILSKLRGEFDGIFALLIRALRRLIKNDYKFTESERANAVLRAYKEDTNDCVYFVNRYIEEKGSQNKGRVNQNALYYAFKISELKDNRQLPAMSEKERIYDKRTILHGIKEALTSEGFAFAPQRSNNNIYLKGIDLNARGRKLLEKNPTGRKYL